jgi:hypothetical protein
MPTRDIFHELVRTVLENEGWIITHDPINYRIALEQAPHVRQYTEFAIG